MTVGVIIAVTVVSSVLRTPLYDLYLEASTLAAEGNYQQSAEVFSEIIERMPDNPRAVYNYALSCFVTNDYPSADSLLSDFPHGVFLEDTLLEAQSSARLGNAMAGGDYAGVESVVEMLLPEISTGESSENLRQNYEVALKWLAQNEPPPQQDNQQQQDDNQDQSEDNQDQHDDNQNQSEDDQNQSDDDNPDENQPEDNQDQPEDNQGQPDDNRANSDDNQNQSDGGSPDEDHPEDDQDHQSDQDQSDNDENNQLSHPSGSEMSPEVAQMILDMVEEADDDTTKGRTGAAIGVPNW